MKMVSLSNSEMVYRCVVTMHLRSWADDITVTNVIVIMDYNKDDFDDEDFIQKIKDEVNPLNTFWIEEIALYCEDPIYLRLLQETEKEQTPIKVWDF